MNEYKVQKHIFKIFSAAEIDAVIANGKVNASVNVNFIVRKLRINWSYFINANGLVNILVSSPMLNNDVVGNFGKFAYDDGAGNIWSSDSFRDTNTLEFIFNEPKYFSNEIEFDFAEYIGSAIAEAGIVLHMEFLG